MSEIEQHSDAELWSEIARRRGRKGGRPKHMQTCRFCKFRGGEREMRWHEPRCPCNPHRRGR